VRPAAPPPAGASTDRSARGAAEDPREIERLERLGFAAWPALEVELLGGWELRFANGFTSRSNSVQVLCSECEEGSAVEERIEACEARYRQRSLSPRFKLTSAARPQDLEARLEARGYRSHSFTDVLAVDFPWRVAASKAAPSGVSECVASIGGDPNEARWRSASDRLTEVPDAQRATLAAVRERIDSPLCASLEQAGEVVAVGLGVVCEGWLFLGEIATAPGQRRRGHARRLVASLLERGRAAGARGAWLQVVSDNRPALALYRAFGFSRRYRYWYRALG
jgi:ribosomal protein S18 acetylase RimI-like enzyme